MKKIALHIAAVSILASTAAQAVSTMYDVTYTTNWTTANDATTPGSAHFSPLIGATHNSSVEFGAVGMSATAGIQQMAETGGTSMLTGEINSTLNANQVISQAGLGAVATTTFTITVDSNFSMVSLFSMIAPSPDWYIGVRNFDLRSGGNWISSSTQTFTNYDAGTDNGSGFTSGNSASSDNVALLSVAHSDRFAGMGGQTIATLSFTQVPEPSTTLLSGVALLSLGLRRKR